MTDLSPSPRPPGLYVLPLSGAITLIGLLMMLCSPLTALSLVNRPPPPEVEAMPVADRPPPPPVRPADAAAVIVFFCLGTLGTFGGVLGLARIAWGRVMMLGFCGLTLAYLAVMLCYRLAGGMPDVAAPTRSAAGLFYFVSAISLGLAAFVMVSGLRYLSRRDVAATFRRVRLG